MVTWERSREFLELYLLFDTSIHSTQDNRDAQYRSFRKKFPAPTALIAGFFGLKYAYMRPILRGESPAHYLQRVSLYLIFSLIMLTILHGASVLKVLVILSSNYALAMATSGLRFAVPVTWLFKFNAGGLSQRMVRRLCFCEFAFWVRIPVMPCTLAFRCRLIVICFQDTWRGVYPRWHINFNITMLQTSVIQHRLSFGMQPDRHCRCRALTFFLISP